MSRRLSYGNLHEPVNARFTCKTVLMGHINTRYANMNDEKTRRIPLSSYREYPAEEMIRRSRSFFQEMSGRRSVRSFSDRLVDREIIENCLLTAGSAPSGANQQPWKFVVVSDQDIKRRIRRAAEEEEQRFYSGGASEEWLSALEPLDTGPQKPFLETAPYLIVVFRENYGIDDTGRKIKHYYVRDSVGIAIGMLIAAIHHAGLVSLTHTPSPMGFLNRLLDRPTNETPTMIIVVGFPADGSTVPSIEKKRLEDIAMFR